MSDLYPVQITQLVKVPPGGWTYTQIETGYTMTNISLAGLKDMVRAHRRANGLDLNPGWWEQVQFEMCMEKPFGDTHCQPDTEVKPEKNFIFRAVHVMTFFRCLREWLLRHQMKLEEQDEAERRAAICAECEFNTADVKGCPGCTGAFRWLKEFLTRGQKTSKEKRLHFCGVCLCSLKLKVWLPGEAISACAGEPPDDKEYPPYCWMHGLKK